MQTGCNGISPFRTNCERYLPAGLFLKLSESIDSISNDRFAYFDFFDKKSGKIMVSFRDVNVFFDGKFLIRLLITS